MGKAKDCLNKTDDVRRCRLTNGLRCVVHSLVMVEVNFSISPLKKSDVNDLLPAWRATTIVAFKGLECGSCDYAAVFGEVCPLTTALGVSDGDQAFPAINLGELALHVLAGAAAFLNEEMDLWGVHGSSQIVVGGA